MPVRSDAEIIMEAARKDAGFDKLLKFRKGTYICDGEEVPLGSEYIAQPIGWVKAWIKFVDGAPTERHYYRVIKGEVPPERPDMSDLDDATWPRDPAGRPLDPWSFQYLLPMEQAGGGELHVFVTSSFGGRRAVSDLCAAWSRKHAKDRHCGMPIIKLQKATMPSKKWGDVVRPDFPITDWTWADRTAVREINVESAHEQIRREMNDDIPFN
jgi:hypothetical protein